MKKIFFWSPHIDPQVATVKSVYNSIKSLSRYKKDLSLTILNVFGEWDNFNHQNIKKIDLIRNENFINHKFKGFLNSRILYLKIFFNSYFPLKKTLKQTSPDYLIIHLITVVPILLFIFNKLQTKLILRISGLPKLNFLRYLLWKIASKKIDFVICPTKETQNYLIKKKIFSSKKIFFIPDPIIDIKKINILKNQKLDHNITKPYFLCIGRFTKQKNHIFLLNFFKNNDYFLKEFQVVIIGDGELKKKYDYIIKSENLKDKVKILSYKSNVYNYIKNSKCIISCSLWEDPGFIMVEAASIGITIITSDCPNGPKEFIDSGNCGFIFRSNNEDSLKKELNNYLNSSNNEIKTKLINAKRKSKKYTPFYNSMRLYDILQTKL